MRHFPSERALWFKLITWVLFPGIFAALVVQQLREPLPWWVWLLTAALPQVLVHGFVLWIWFTTGYTVTETELIVRSAFLTWRVPLAGIRRVRATRNPLASPALSMNRLEIRTAKGFGPLISPQNRAEFLNLLRERCPQAEIED